MKKIIIHTYNKATTDAVRKQLRHKNGRFAGRASTILISVLAIAGILATAYLSQHVRPAVRIVDKVITVDTTSKIITDGKTEVLDLLENCESTGNANAINWEDNGCGKNRSSFGAYMLKVGTIQGFKKGLTDFQAIALAGDKAQARELSSYIIFGTEGGIYNWKNCMVKNGLLEKVNFIKQLELKINK